MITKLNPYFVSYQGGAYGLNGSSLSGISSPSLLIVEIVKTPVSSSVAVMVSVNFHVSTIFVFCIAACVTLIVCGATPVPLMVIVPVSGFVVVFAAAVTVIVSLLLPDVGVMVSQVASPRLTVQSVLDVMSNICCPPSDVNSNEGREMVRVLTGVGVTSSIYVPNTPKTGCSLYCDVVPVGMCRVNADVFAPVNTLFAIDMDEGVIHSRVMEVKLVQ